VQDPQHGAVHQREDQAGQGAAVAVSGRAGEYSSSIDTNSSRDRGVKIIAQIGLEWMGLQGGKYQLNEAALRYFLLFFL